MIASTQTNQPFSGAARAASTDEEVRLATQRLRAAGLRLTRPRVNLLTALSRRREPSRIEQLHRDVSAAGCDLVTIYRCLIAFEQIGLVQRSFLHDGTSVFSLTVTAQPRYFVACRSSSQIVELDPQLAAELHPALAAVEKILRDRGYRDVGHLVEFFASDDPSPPAAPRGDAIRKVAPRRSKSPAR